jgi:hypothetical protein
VSPIRVLGLLGASLAGVAVGLVLAEYLGWSRPARVEIDEPGGGWQW